LESQPNELISVSIPADLHAQIKKSIEGKGFSTVDDFVTYVLRVTMGKQPVKSEDVDDSGVVDQLKALGYI
jgi:Arc/MetJ-type ribon-helix-helix transcriptional regulator